MRRLAERYKLRKRLEYGGLLVYFEAGLYIVIKQPQVPGDRVMAGLTVVRKFASVRIVIKVAADALGASFGKHLGFMAGLALEIAMLSQERESRQVMIE